MKKRDLWAGVGMILAGSLCLLAAALLWETRTALGSLLCGFCGAFAVPGVAQVCKYVKWTRPKNAPVYRERLEREQIELRDERKSMLRDKSGRYAYILGLLTLSAAVIIFSLLEAFGMIGREEARLMVLFLGGYILFQAIAGIVICRLLEKRY